MKKLLPLLCFLVITGTRTSAQVHYEPGSSETTDDHKTEPKVKKQNKPQKINVAPELGLNLSNMAITGTDATTTNFKAGLAVGAIVDFAFAQHLYLQPGLFFQMNGCKYKDIAGGTGTYAVNSLQVPINVEYKLNDDKQNRFFFGVGMFLGVNISGKSTDAGLSSTLKFGSAQFDTTTGNTGDDLKLLDLGLAVNAGYLLKNGFYARAHYQLGLKNMDPNASNDGSAVKTSAIGITVGYYLMTRKDEDKKK